MEVRELDAGKRVRWAVVGGPDEWLGTTVTFELREEDDYTIVLFAHEGWREPVEFMHHCSTKWAVYLLSLKALLETGTGAAHPARRRGRQLGLTVLGPTTTKIDDQPQRTRGSNPMTNTDHIQATPAAAATDYQKTIRVHAAARRAVRCAHHRPRPGRLVDRSVTGSGDTGGELRFSFGSGTCVIHVDEATRPSAVRWTVTECAFVPDWEGTRPSFTITPLDDGACELQFRHGGLTSELDCIEECTRGWDHFIVSLRDYVESGRGMPRGSDEDDARRR